jgi:hypothetical protein
VAALCRGSLPGERIHDASARGSIANHENEQVQARPPDLVNDAATRGRIILNSPGTLTRRFRRKERAEYLFLDVRRDAGAVVAYPDFRSVAKVFGSRSKGRLKAPVWGACWRLGSAFLRGGWGRKGVPIDVGIQYRHCDVCSRKWRKAAFDTDDLIASAAMRGTSHDMGCDLRLPTREGHEISDAGGALSSAVRKANLSGQRRILD